MKFYGNVCFKSNEKLVRKWSRCRNRHSRHIKFKAYARVSVKNQSSARVFTHFETEAFLFGQRSRGRVVVRKVWYLLLVQSLKSNFINRVGVLSDVGQPVLSKFVADAKNV